MRNKRWLALIMALVMVFSLSVSAMAEYDETAYEAAAKKVTTLAEDYTGKTVILHSNDVHGQIDGYAYIAALKAAYEAKNAEVILVDAGDFSQGDINVSSSKGASAVTMMNAAGYDIATLGNHEFDFGYPQLKDNLSKAEFKVICADVTVDATGAPIYDAVYTYTTKDGVKIGFFGMETPETATKVNPGLIKEITFASFDGLYTSAQKAVDSLSGADLVIGLTHLGVNDESAQNGYRSLDLYEKVKGIDFLIDGHSHTVMTAGPNGEPIQSTGTKFANIGVVIINNATKKIEDHYLVPISDGKGNYNEGVQFDETVAAKAKEIADAVEAEYGKVFAVTSVTLNGERNPGNRTEETNLGDLITDALIWSAKSGISKVSADNIVAITNGGGIRATIPAGDMTKKDINKVLPFGNTVAVIYVTGAQLLEALEASTYCTPSEIGGFPQTSGIQWTVNAGKSYDQGELYVLNGKDTTYYAPKSIQRVSVQSINGKAFDEKAMYAVVTNNFIAAGGDTYNVFNKAYVRTDEYAGFDTAIPMDEAVMDYITTELKGTVTAARYGEPAGRLTIIPDPLASYTDVNMAAWYVPALRYVIEGKIMVSTGAGTFSPDTTMTRAMVMKQIANLAGAAAETTQAAGDAHWYDKAVAWAILNGISDGSRPDDACTREEFATMLYNYEKGQGKGFVGAWMFLLTNPDAADISESADEAMHWMVMNKVMSGVDAAGTLAPQKTTTRAEIAKMLLNLSNVK